MVPLHSADAVTTLLFLSAEAHSLPLANFYAKLLRVPDHQIPDYWNFTVLSERLI
jgi:hypothetical protein